MIRTLISLLILAVLAGVSEAQNASTRTDSTPQLFDYDAKLPLDVQDKILQESESFTIHDLSYASPKGGRVPAYLVVPKGKGPFAAVLFGHYGLGTRTEFIPEAPKAARFV